MPPETPTTAGSPESPVSPPESPPASPDCSPKSLDHRPGSLAEFIACRHITFPIVTERLELSLLQESDAAALWHYWQLPETSEWTSTRPASADQLITERLAAGNTLVVRRRGGPHLEDSGAGSPRGRGEQEPGAADREPAADPTVIGDVLIKIHDAWAQPEAAERARSTEAELGCAFHPAIAGQGYAFEAVTAAIDLTVSIGIRRIEAFCMAGNTPSWRLLERLGLRREGTYISESLHRDHGWVDGFSYAILATEWQANRS